jgi:hypothetical protein
VSGLGSCSSRVMQTLLRLDSSEDGRSLLGVRADDEKMEVLSIEVGDREQKTLWAELFQSLERRGSDMNAVELGIMDGLAGLESAFSAAFPNARTQRCQVHAKRNALKRVSVRERAAFKADLDRVFYAKTEAKARGAFVELVSKWKPKYPGAVGVIERDLDSLLRFLAWEARYWASLRTPNPIERVNKEFKRRTKAMEITGGESTTHRLLAYVALTMNLSWRKYALSAPKNFYTLKAAGPHSCPDASDHCSQSYRSGLMHWKLGVAEDMLELLRRRALSHLPHSASVGSLQSIRPR